jgi:Tfp pilus assembly protein PilX
MNPRERISDERGWALITAILLMTIMLGTILGVANYVSGQTRLGATSRTRETAFNLAEAALNMQVFALSRDWPGAGSLVAPYTTCTPASTGNRCPDAASVSNLIASPDSTGATWETQVHDNSDSKGNATPYYSDAVMLGQAGKDVNADGRLWVRATATARGKKRTIVELVRVEEEALDLPHAAVVAGRFQSSNNGQKVVVDTTGGTGANGFVAVRCTPTMGETATTTCLDQPLGSGSTSTPAKWDALVQTQISPYSGHVQSPYLGTSTAMTQFTRDQLKARAIADGKYFLTCPPSWPTGTIVYIESGDCSYSSNVTVNSSQQPGLLLLNRGTLTLAGTGDYWGVIYCVNAQGSSGPVLNLNGSGTLHGGVFVDGDGIVVAGGTSNTNIKYEDSALSAIKGYGNAGLIQNTWREIKG